MKVGVLGGTFDPIHLGHLAAARAAMDCAGLDTVLFVPTGTPPHRGAAVAGAKQRVEMCRLAIAGEERFDVSDIEVTRSGASYTVDTLKALSKARPGDDLFLILGWDAARLFKTWHEPREVQRLATVVVVTRPGSGDVTQDALQSAGLPAASIICERVTPDISGSALRRAIAGGESVADRLPAAVSDYVAANHLYMDNHDVGC